MKTEELKQRMGLVEIQHEIGVPATENPQTPALLFDYDATQVYLHIHYNGLFYTGKLCNTAKLRTPYIPLGREVYQSQYNKDGALRVERKFVKTERFSGEIYLQDVALHAVKKLMPNCELIYTIYTKEPLLKRIYNFFTLKGEWDE